MHTCHIDLIFTPGPLQAQNPQAPECSKKASHKTLTQLQALKPKPMPSMSEVNI